MYLSHFSLNERPFSISPDPRFLFMSNRYREALAHLTYGVEDGGGFVLLTGEVGTGKTTVCRCLLQQLPDNTRLAFVLNPKLNSLELLATICDELDIKYPENCDSLKVLTDKLSDYLLKCYQKGLSVVVMIDEAQNIATEVLEQIRLLTNLETNQKKLLQIILVGQPELQEKLAKRELRQLAQRITARYHLRPLNLK
ncbi:MAG: AAA family ATPase, partial [Kangiellaceae bacterium]